MEYCKLCGSIKKTDGKCSNRGCGEEAKTKKKRVWQIGETVIRSKYQITYLEAQELARSYFDKAIEKRDRNL
jgi:hypothetical protein